jgi:hypothetical protein
MTSVERIGAIAQREMIAAFLEVFPDAPTLNLVDPKVGPNLGRFAVVARLAAVAQRHSASMLLMMMSEGR